MPLRRLILILNADPLLRVICASTTLMLILSLALIVIFVFCPWLIGVGVALSAVTDGLVLSLKLIASLGLCDSVKCSLLR